MARDHKDYSGTPLYRKLGIRPGGSVLVVSPPGGFRETLGQLPEGAQLLEGDAARVDVAILFATRAEDLEQFSDLAGKLAPSGGLWVAWPKKASKIPSEIDFAFVQETGLRNGLVDNKSCSIDERWQGLRFVVRLKDRKAEAG